MIRYSRNKTNLVLISVHTRQGTDVAEDILECISQLEGIDIAKTELNMCVNDKLSKTKNFAAQVESVSKTRLLTFLSRKSSEK
jgi:pyrimidine operon attenuation protein/uracil phosphoribosyltransferase